MKAERNSALLASCDATLNSRGTAIRNSFFKAYGFWHLGEGFQTVLFTWYMTFQLNLSPSEIGFFQSITLLPFLLISGVGGRVTDMLGAKASFALSTGAFACFLMIYSIMEKIFGYIPFLFIVYCMLVGSVSAISNTAIDTFIARATPSSAVENSITASKIQSFAKLPGTLIGLVLPLISSIGGFLTNSIIFILSILFLMRHRSEKESNVLRTVREKILTGGIRNHFRRNADSVDILFSSALLGLFALPTTYVLVPVILRERFPEYGSLIAFLSTTTWIGSIISSLIARRLLKYCPFPGMISIAVWFMLSISIMFLLAVDSFTGLCIISLFIGMFKVGKALVYGWYLSNGPRDQVGTLVSLDQTAFWGLATLGTFFLGVVVDHMGVSAAVTINATLFAAGVSVLILRGNLIKLRNNVS